MDVVLGLVTGVGLSAACGFRVFVPLLVAGIAGRTGHIELSEGFLWIQSWPAMIAFGCATGFEIAAYYIPWVDNLLDAAATPAAVIAGTLLTAAMVGDLNPFLQWTLGIVAGGGAAAAIQGMTATTRAASTATTGGAANPVVSTAEAGASTGLSILAVVLPLVGLLVAVLLVGIIVRLVFRRRTPVESGVTG